MNTDVCESWDDTYVRCSNLVRGVARRANLSLEVAEDLFHTVFERFIANPGSYRGGNFDAWFVRVAQNAAIDLHRHSRRRRRILEGSSDDNVVDIQELCIDRIERSSVMSALSQLPPTKRTLVELSFLREFTHLEISAMSGLPLGTVKTRIRSGLQKLREITATGLQSIPKQ